MRPFKRRIRTRWPLTSDYAITLTKDGQIFVSGGRWGSSIPEEVWEQVNEIIAQLKRKQPADVPGGWDEG